MAQTQFLPDAAGETKRPDLLNVLGILSFVNCGIFILVYAFGLIGMAGVAQMPEDEFVGLIRDAVTKYMPGDESLQIEQIGRILHANGVALMLIYLARTVARLFGAIGIWKARKAGFYLYAAAQLIGLFLPHIFLPLNLLGFFGPLMTVAMTAAYGSQLKRLQ